jgi:hypothetical protein
VREREREVSGREQEIPFIGRPPVTYFLWPRPTFQYFHRLPVKPSNYESIHGLIHSWSQSLHESITSPKPISWQSNPKYMTMWGTSHIQTIIRFNHMIAAIQSHLQDSLLILVPLLFLLHL